MNENHAIVHVQLAVALQKTTAQDVHADTKLHPVNHQLLVQQDVSGNRCHARCVTQSIQKIAAAVTPRAIWPQVQTFACHVLRPSTVTVTILVSLSKCAMLAVPYVLIQTLASAVRHLASTYFRQVFVVFVIPRTATMLIMVFTADPVLWTARPAPLKLAQRAEITSSWF